MNKWTAKSIEIANSPGYLDKLSKVYVMNINPLRPIPDKVRVQIATAYNQKDSKKLVKLLIDESEVFPVKDSYVGFLRKKPKAVEENPITVERIAQRLYSLGLEGVIRESSRPKETNRQLGHAFKLWFQGMGYPVLSRNEIVSKKAGIYILGGSDKVLADFARKELNCHLKKGIDLVIKVNQQYIIGEAKFLTTPGGEQDRGFDDASAFISEESGSATRIAVLDGYIWLESLRGLHDKIVQSNQNIMSTLVLNEFIRSFK